MFSFLLILLLSAFSLPYSLQMDQTLVHYEKNHSVVSKVVSTLDASGIFSEKDNNFLHRIAWQMSRDGLAENTYRRGYYGGIWQVDKSAFDDTQNLTAHSQLGSIHAGILEKFGKRWMEMKWYDPALTEQFLEAPFYSGLAARIYISIFPGGSIPPTLEKQAEYWSTNYITEQDKGTAQQFIESTKAHEQISDCVAKRDLCFILDGSGSVGEGNFRTSLEFLWELVSGMPIGADQTHVSMITYSTNWELVFRDLYDNNTIYRKIMGAKYPAGGTNTGGALSFALTDAYSFFRNSSGVLPVFIVLTDGQSQDDIVGPAWQVTDKGITTISVGIGSAIDSQELFIIANGKNENVFVSTYEFLDSIQRLLEHSTCATPAEVRVNEGNTQFSIGPKQSTYVKVQVPIDGVTITINLVTGQVTGYISYSDTTPNSAVYDDIIPAGKPVYFQYQASNTTIYIGFTADSASSNVFQLSIVAGKQYAAANTLIPSYIAIIASILGKLLLA